MTVLLTRGRYRARLAAGTVDLRASQSLRHRVFVDHGGAQPRPGGLDVDDFDSRCVHVLVEEVTSRRLVGCFRLLAMIGSGIADSYAAQFYDLSGLAAYPWPMVEMGRFCVHPEVRDSDVLRVAWGAMTRYVDDNAIAFLFGCSSFVGTDPCRYAPVFDLLAARHLAPPAFAPRIGAEQVVRFAGASQLNLGAGLAQMPPLLRNYLAMGGWVSDHAVIDADMNTLHVFTGLEIATIPPARVRALRAIAGSDPLGAG